MSYLSEDEELDELRSVVAGRIHRNLPAARLVEIAVQKKEGMLASNGAFNAMTVPRTGRSPKDKFVVRTGRAADLVWWDVNAAFEPDQFAALLHKVADYVSQRDMFVFDGYAGADPRYRLPVRIKTEFAWHSLFVHQLFIRPTHDELRSHKPEFTVVCVPNFRAVPAVDGTHSDAFIVLNFESRLALIGGTRYAGEMKKSIFTVMNYILPQRGVLSMHCSANKGADGSTALFFGLSGTGKTTLSADPNRGLIGDDEHGWSDDGIFNLEGGCYAKCIRLSQKNEPEIWNAIRFGSVVENVILEDDRTPDYDDGSVTENTRVAYPLHYIENAVIPSVGKHPKTVIFLTADATGVLPPVARLNEHQAMYHFLSGYTSKLAGTETGVTEPQSVFSTCFGQPFLPLAPGTYSKMLGEKLHKHGSACYLINTGWTGGKYGEGERMSLPYTRAIVTAVLNGELDHAESVTDPVFGFAVPKAVNGVPAEVLTPRNTWKDPAAYDAAAHELAGAFRRNFEKYAGTVDKEVEQAGPKA